MTNSKFFTRRLILNDRKTPSVCLREEQRRLRELGPRIIDAIQTDCAGELRGLLRMFDVHLWWPKFAKEIIKLTDPISLEVKNEFRRHWVEKGGHIRDVLRDDIQLIVILEKILPRYWGPYPRTPLYRGENVERLEKGLLGLNWSSSVNIAREFASGLNADTHKGGVLLRVFPEMSSIVSGPYPYFYTARKEEEFILSPKCASKRLVELEYFPCVGC